MMQKDNSRCTTRCLATSGVNPAPVTIDGLFSQGITRQHRGREMMFPSSHTNRSPAERRQNLASILSEALRIIDDVEDGAMYGVSSEAASCFYRRPEC